MCRRALSVSSCFDVQRVSGIFTIAGFQKVLFNLLSRLFSLVSLFSLCTSWRGQGFCREVAGGACKGSCWDWRRAEGGVSSGARHVRSVSVCPRRYHVCFVRFGLSKGKDLRLFDCVLRDRDRERGVIRLALGRHGAHKEPCWDPAWCVLLLLYWVSSHIGGIRIRPPRHITWFFSALRGHVSANADAGAGSSTLGEPT